SQPTEGGRVSKNLLTLSTASDLFMRSGATAGEAWRSACEGTSLARAPPFGSQGRLPERFLDAAGAGFDREQRRVRAAGSERQAAPRANRCWAQTPRIATGVAEWQRLPVCS